MSVPVVSPSLACVIIADKQNKSLITPYKVDHLPQAGFRLALSISDPHNPQPYLQGDASDYLLGTQPTFNSKRGEVEENVYGIWVERGRGIVVSLISPSHPMQGTNRGTGLALLDVLSFQLWKADSARMAWASYVPFTPFELS